MNGVYSDIPRIYTAFAEWAACLVYLYLLGKRYTRMKMIWLSAAALFVQAGVLELTGDFPVAFWILGMTAAVMLMYVFLWRGSGMTLMASGYCCAKAFLLAEFAASLEWQFHTYLAELGITAAGIQILLLAGIYGVVFGIAYWLERPLKSGEYLSQLSMREIMAAAGIVIFAFAFGNLSFVIKKTPFTSSVPKDIFIIRTMADLGGLAFLYALQSRISEYMAEKEVMAIQNTLKSQYEQYRSYQESMEWVHMKYHDLKHQIAGLRVETNREKQEEWLDAMEQELNENELGIQTRNPVLDAIFGAKMRQAKKNNICMTCVIDGAQLKFMHVTDICTIFGNALDNAVENVMMQEDLEKRLIHVTVTAHKNFVLIEISNYCEKKLELKKGELPKTTKLDWKNHGFGLKSIRCSAEKYGGNMTIGQNDNWFELKILFPKQ